MKNKKPKLPKAQMEKLKREEKSRKKMIKDQKIINK